LGKTGELVNERKEYITPVEVLSELNGWLQNNAEEARKITYFTFSGSGEPTLNTGIGDIIKEIKKITTSAVAVITNASLLNDADVRLALQEADLVVPSLDTIIPEIFMKVNRPCRNIKIDEIINGLVIFRKEFPGKIWLEVMLIRGLNDDLAQIRKLKEAIDLIKPDKIHLNSPVRTTSEVGVLPAGKRKLEKIKEILGDKCEII